MFKRLFVGIAVVTFLASSLNAYQRRVLFEEFTGQS